MDQHDNRMVCLVLATLPMVAFAACTKETSEKKANRGVEEQKVKPKATVKPDVVDPLAAADCDALWETKVSREPKGLVLGYETIMDTTVPNAPAGASGSMRTVISTEEKVLESGIDRIVTTKTTTMTNMGVTTPSRTAEHTELRATWVAQCKSAVGNGLQLPANIGVEVKYDGDTLAKRDETITVRGGTFAAHYVKNKTRMSASTTFGTTAATTSDGSTEVWYIGEGMAALTVKSITVGTTSVSAGSGSMLMNRNVVHELVKFVKP